MEGRPRNGCRWWLCLSRQPAAGQGARDRRCFLFQAQRNPRPGHGQEQLGPQEAQEFSRNRAAPARRAAAFPSGCGKLRSTIHASVPPTTLHGPFNTSTPNRSTVSQKQPSREQRDEFIEIDMRRLLPTAPCVLELRSPSGFEMFHNSLAPPYFHPFIQRIRLRRSQSLAASRKALKLVRNPLFRILPTRTMARNRPMRRVAAPSTNLSAPLPAAVPSCVL